MRKGIFTSVLLSLVWVAISLSPGMAAEKKYRFMLGTAGTGGEVYIWGGGAAKVVNQFSKDVQLTAQLTAGSGENLIRIKAGTLKIGLSSNEWNWELYNGKGGCPNMSTGRFLPCIRATGTWDAASLFLETRFMISREKSFLSAPKGRFLWND